MNSNDYFLANKCGYGQCCNTIDSTSYINLGGFILQTRICDEHKEDFVKFVVALNRAILVDPVIYDILYKTKEEFVDKINKMVDVANKEMPYEKSNTFQSMKDEEIFNDLSYKPNSKKDIKNKKEFNEFGCKKSKEIKEKYNQDGQSNQKTGEYSG